MANKAKRQPKAGEMALRTSPRFAQEPRELMATTPLYVRPASEKLGYVIPEGFRIKRLKPGRAQGADTWRSKGGMMGGRNGACKAVCSHNGLGVIPQAFSPHKG